MQQAPIVNQRADPAVRSAPLATTDPASMPEFAFADICVWFAVAAAIYIANAWVAGAVFGLWAGHKAIQRYGNPITHLADRAGYGDDLRAFQALPLPQQARYLLRGDVPLAGDADAPVPAAAPVAPEPVPTSPRAAPVRPRWLQVVNDDPDRHPHVLILGPTGAGKTTLATAVMADRGGRVIVLSPKVSAGAWRGAEVVTLDDDASYAPLVAAMADLEQEKRDRVVVLRQQGREALEPLTVVFDELQDLTTHVPQVGEWMVNMSSLGRELNMRLVGVGTTDDALNIRGWKASRHNYAQIAMTPDRRATLNDGMRAITVETQEIVRRAKAAKLRPWRGDLLPPALDLTPFEIRYADELQQARDMARLRTELNHPTREMKARIAPRLAAKRGYVPTAEDQAALHSLLGLGDDAPPSPPAAQQVVVEDSGRQVVINVSQTAAPPRAPLRRGGITVKDRRRRLAYIEAAKAGESFAAAYKRLGGSRNEMHALFAKHKVT